MMLLVIFYLFSDLIYLSNIAVVESNRVAEACYGSRECDYYALSCEQDEVIRLGTLEYGRKEEPAVSFRLTEY